LNHSQYSVKKEDIFSFARRVVDVGREIGEDEEEEGDDEVILVGGERDGGEIDRGDEVVGGEGVERVDVAIPKIESRNEGNDGGEDVFIGTIAEIGGGKGEPESEDHFTVTGPHANRSPCSGRFCKQCGKECPRG
jgi:hypothetical protein